jgi:hypothetical protein
MLGHRNVAGTRMSRANSDVMGHVIGHVMGHAISNQRPIITAVNV